MIEYEEVKNSIKRISEEKTDILDTLFLPMVFGLHYQISGYGGNDLKVGYMIMDHQKGIITAKPDEDSYIIFYRDSDSDINNDWDNDNEIHVYLENNHIIVDLPRFGAISRQSEIKFDDSEADKNSFEALIGLIDFDIRSKEQDNSGIKYMERLQFRDDLGSFISNPNEHLRFISQVLNDAIKAGDDDLIDFLILKVKQRFDPLNDKELEQNVRSAIKQDFAKRVEEDNEFIIVEKQDQIEREKRRREKISSNKTIKKSPISLDIKEIFSKSAENNQSSEAQQIINNKKENEVEVNNNASEKKITKKLIKQGGNDDEQSGESTFQDFI